MTAAFPPPVAVAPVVVDHLAFPIAQQLALVRRQSAIAQSYAAVEPSVMDAVVASTKKRPAGAAAPDGSLTADKTGTGGDPEEM